MMSALRHPEPPPLTAEEADYFAASELWFAYWCAALVGDYYDSFTLFWGRRL
jgi:hypothetical protein